nr:VWA domain-containing protein [Ardenticatena sp.]
MPTSEQAPNARSIIRTEQKRILLLGCSLVILLLCSLAATGVVSLYRFLFPETPRTITVVVNPAVAAWVRDAAERFNAGQYRDTNGTLLAVQVREEEAGQTIAQWNEAPTPPDVWIPDHEVWAKLAADTTGIPMPACPSTSRTALVIATWKPLAQSLGWPARDLGWLDFGSLAADPSAWAYYSGGQFGDEMRLGHAHPGLAGSGAFALLAVIHAAQAQSSQALTPSDISSPLVQASVRSFESAVAWFSPTTAHLARRMDAQGPTSISAAVLYENMVADMTRDDVVALYPFEGTFMATNPACAFSEAGQVFVAFLLERTTQDRLSQYHLRAPSPSGAGELAVPVLPVPPAETLVALQTLWLSERKPVNLVMVIDTSGSMAGEKIASVQNAAADFIAQMGEHDQLSIILFSDKPVVWVREATIAEKRETIIENIQYIDADGGTALYDAVFDAVQLVRTTSSPDYTNAIIVLTDGQDTASERILTADDPTLLDMLNQTDATIFTVAFGEDADMFVLARLAEIGRGAFYRADETSIGAIYDEMSAAFGGAAGIGR